MSTYGMNSFPEAGLTGCGAGDGTGSGTGDGTSLSFPRVTTLIEALWVELPAELTAETEN
jgi:hypothetical protein